MMTILSWGRCLWTLLDLQWISDVVFVARPTLFELQLAYRITLLHSETDERGSELGVQVGR